MSALGGGKKHGRQITPGEARPSTPALALCPHSGQHLGTTGIGGRGQLDALILGTRLGEQNQGCPQNFPSTLVMD